MEGVHSEITVFIQASLAFIEIGKTTFFASSQS
jgi:hypothetical protein